MQSLILLTGASEQAALLGRLRDCNPLIDVLTISTLEDLTAISPEVLEHARLIAFATPVIVPPSVLARLGHGAYNFHPGPPAFPGISPAQFAVYFKARQFGVTVHRMAERVDSGAIVGTTLFDVPEEITVWELESLSYRELARQFWALSPALATNPEPLRDIGTSWGDEKSSRRRYGALCSIPTDIAKEELTRRIAAFGGGYFGMTPTITLHGFRFQFVPEPTPTALPAGE